jgi:hypothetical protein
MTLRIGQRIRLDQLEVELVHAGLLRLSGSLSSTAARLQFQTLLESLHARLATQQPTRFVIDVRALDFVDSSAIRLFRDWISQAAAAAYRLVFYTDPDITWHRLSFGVLQSLAPGWVEVTDDEVTGITRVGAVTR